MTTDEYNELKARINDAKPRLPQPPAPEEGPKTAFELLPDFVQAKIAEDYCVYLDVAQHIANGTWPYPDDVHKPGIILSMARRFFASFNFMEGSFTDAEREFGALMYDHFRNQTHQSLPRGEPWKENSDDVYWWRRLCKDKARWARIRHRQLAADWSEI